MPPRPEPRHRGSSKAETGTGLPASLREEAPDKGQPEKKTPDGGPALM